LYLSLLRKFATLHQLGLQPLQQALDAGDVGTAERLAHTLKGLAGNIGASALQAEMEKVENALRAQAAIALIRAQLDKPAALLAELLAGLQGWLAQRPEPPQASAFAPETLAPVCRELLTLLADDDPQAVEVLQSHAAMLQTALGDNYRTIEAAVAGFDFQTAWSALSSAMTQANVTT
jgi:two-component system sensor histidine kinase/response regulator